MKLKRKYGKYGRFDKRAPPWKYKKANTQTEYETTNLANQTAIFITIKQLHTSLNGYGATTSATTTITQRDINTLGREPCISHDTSTTAPADPGEIIPPLTGIFPSAPPPNVTIRRPPSDATHHVLHPQSQLPALNTCTRHPSDSEQYSLGHPSDFHTSDRHPSDQHPTMRHITDHNTETITHSTESTAQNGTPTSSVYMCNPPPFAAIEPISYISTLLSHTPTQHLYEFPHTTRPTATSLPTHSVCLTPQLRAPPRIKHTHITCPTFETSDEPPSIKPPYPPHIFPRSTPPKTTPIERRRTALAQGTEIQRTPHTRRNSDDSTRQPNTPSNTPPTMRHRHLMTAKFGLWYTILSSFRTTHEIPPLLQQSKVSQFDRRRPPHRPPPPPSQRTHSSTTMPSRTRADFDPGATHAPEDPELRDFHDAILPDDPPEPGDRPQHTRDYHPEDFTDIAVATRQITDAASTTKTTHTTDATPTTPPVRTTNTTEPHTITPRTHPRTTPRTSHTSTTSDLTPRDHPLNTSPPSTTHTHIPTHISPTDPPNAAITTTHPHQDHTTTTTELETTATTQDAPTHRNRTTLPTRGHNFVPPTPTHNPNWPPPSTDPKTTAPCTPTAPQRKSPPENNMVTPHAHPTGHTLPDATTTTPSTFTPTHNRETRTHHTTQQTHITAPTETHPPHDTNTTAPETTEYDSMDPTALFTSIFHSNPSFATSFMQLIQQYKPTPFPLPHLPTAARASIHQSQQNSTPTTNDHLPPTITRHHTRAFIRQPTETHTPTHTPTTPTFPPTITHPSPRSPPHDTPPSYPTTPPSFRPPNPATPDRETPWLVAGRANRPIRRADTTNITAFPPLATPPPHTRHPPTTPTTHQPITTTDHHPQTTSTTFPSDGEDYNEEEEIPLSQSDYLPPPTTSSSTTAHSTLITALTDQHDTLSTDHTTLAERHAEGRVWTRDAINRRCIVVKLAIVASDSCDQSPTTSALEPVIDAIISSLGLTFTIDRVAILSFDNAIPTRQGSIYFSYAYLSPRSSNPHYLQHQHSANEVRRQLEILQGSLHGRLDGPHFFDTIPHLPPIASHLRVSLPLINDMDETFRFLIDGVSVALLLGNNGRENVLTLRYLGFLIFKAIRKIYPTLPPHEPFPHSLAKLKTRYDIGRVISVKKIRFSRIPPPNTNPPPPVRSLLPTTQSNPHPLLGIVITNSTPLCDTLNDAIHHVCITHQSKLHLCGHPSNGISVHLHQKPSTIPDQLRLAREISTNHNPLHDASQHKIVRGIRIHQHALLKDNYLVTAAGSIANCVGFLPDFTNGMADIHLTGLFRASRETSFLRPDNVTSRIIEANAHTVNLTPGPPIKSQSPPQSLRTPTTNGPPGHPTGRGRGSQRQQQSLDRSGALYRVQANSSLRLSTTPIHKYYVVINGIGGLSTANIYAMDFDNDGIRLLITHVPFSLHKSFPTYPEAWTYFTSYYPHIKTPDEATFMNENCPREASNLTNPSPRFQEIQGLHFTPPHPNVRAFKHYDEVSDNVKTKRDAASDRMTSLRCTPLDGFTFLHSYDPPSSRWLTPAENQPQPIHDPPDRNAHPPPRPQPNDDTSMQASSAAPSIPDHARLRHGPDNHDTLMHERTTTPSSIRFRCIDNNTPATTTQAITNGIDDDANTQQSIDLLLDDDEHDEYIEGLSQDSNRLQITNAPKKRSRHESELSVATRETARTFTYVIFNVEMATTETNILDELLPAFERADIPATAYDSSLRFHGFPSIYNLVEKHAILKCLDLSLTGSIIRTISDSLNASYAYTTDHPPPAPTPEDIDMLPLYNPPRYCQVTSCTFHHNRRDVFPNTPHGLHAAEAHGVHLHHALYSSLTTTELASIGWLRCCDLCPTIHLNPELMSEHRSRCITYTNSQAFSETRTNPNDHLRRGRFSSLYLVCPPHRTRELDELITENPTADPITLFAVVHGWHTATRSTQDDNPTATTNREE